MERRIVRRTVLKGLVAGVAGLLVPRAGVVEADDARRIWAFPRNPLVQPASVFVPWTGDPLRVSLLSGGQPVLTQALRNVGVQRTAELIAFDADDLVWSNVTVSWEQTVVHVPFGGGYLAVPILTEPGCAVDGDVTFHWSDEGVARLTLQ